jgi:hypothetical protein
MTLPNPTAPPAAPEGQPPQTDTPPWGEDFDAAKAWNLIKGLRSDKEKLAQRPVLDDDAQRRLTEFARLEQASKTELERKTEEVTRWQTEAEKWRKASVGSRIEALAAPDFADPSDAAHALDPAKYLGADGLINDEQIRADLADVLNRKPHYRRSTEAPGPRVPAPNPAQGAGGTRTAADPAAEFASILQGQLAGPR